jgi:hypothetical protein
MAKKIITNNTIQQKDENGIYLPPVMVSPPKKKRVRDPKPADISLSDLMDKYLLLLYRETKHLLRESVSDGKLSKDSSHCMRENVRLIIDLKKKEKELLDSLSAEELDKLTNDHPQETR